jgi:hypothetical protein
MIPMQVIVMFLHMRFLQVLRSALKSNDYGRRLTSCPPAVNISLQTRYSGVELSMGVTRRLLQRRHDLISRPRTRHGPNGRRSLGTRITTGHRGVERSGTSVHRPDPVCHTAASPTLPIDWPIKHRLDLLSVNVRSTVAHPCDSLSSHHIHHLLLYGTLTKRPHTAPRTQRGY